MKYHQIQHTKSTARKWLLVLCLYTLPVNANEQTDDELDDLFAMDIEQLLDVEVTTAAKKSQKLSDAPSIITVVTASEIRRMGAATLTDVLVTVPGFTPINHLKSDRLMVVRGLSLKDGVLVLIDGVTVNDAFDGSFDFYQRPIDDIERLEVIRGPGSALYGGYAVSAVVHIFTKKAQAGDSNYRVTLGGGSFSQRRFSASTATDLAHFSSRLDAPINFAASFSYVDHQGDKLTIQQDAIFTPDQGQFLPPLSNPTLTPTTRQEAVEKFNGHVSVQAGDFSVNFSHGQLISNPLLSHAGLVTQIDRTIKETTLDRLSIQYASTVNDGFFVDSKVYWVSNEAKLFGQSQPPQIWGDEDQDGLNEDFITGIIENFRHKTLSSGIDLEFTYTNWNAHQWLFGLAYNKTQLDEVEKVANISLSGRGASSIFPAQDVTPEFMPTGVERTMSSIYVQDLWQVSDSTDITTGIRFGDYSDFGTTFNPRLGLIHRFDSPFYAKLLYGGAFKPPAFSQLFDATPTLSPFRIQGNSGLKPTKIDTIELQLGYDFSSRLKANLSLFGNETNNEIFYDSTPGIERWKNSGERRSRGVELELRGAWLGFDIAYVNYAYQKTSGVVKGAGANIHPAHRLNTGGSYPIAQKTRINFTLSYFSSPQREMGDIRPKIDAKTLLRIAVQADDMFDLGINGDFSISNAFDQDGRDEIEQSVGLLDDIPLQGRTYTFSLTRNF